MIIGKLIPAGTGFAAARFEEKEAEPEGEEVEAEAEIEPLSEEPLEAIPEPTPGD